MRTFKVQSESGEEALVVIHPLGVPGELDEMLVEDLIELEMIGWEVEPQHLTNEGLKAIVELARQEWIGAYEEGVDPEEHLPESLTDDEMLTMEFVLNLTDILRGLPVGTWKGN